MKLKLRYLLLSSVLIGALASLYVKTTQHIDFAAHERCDGDFQRLLRLDSELNQDVLKVRSHLLDDYDPFPQQIEEMKLLTSDLANVPSFVSEADRGVIRVKADELSRLLTEKEDRIERFKSQNAVLNNSLRYMALTGTELVKRVASTPDGRELEGLLNELMREVLVFSLHPDDSQAVAIRDSLEKLEQWRKEHGGFPENRALVTLARHADSIVRRQPETDTLTRELIAPAMREHASDLLNFYHARFAKELRTADAYRSLLHIACVLLVAGIGCTIYALSASNANLERRVRERTRDLSSKNDQLQEEIAERERAESEKERLHRDLIAISRQAGMAEVASSVLHNVGNVLNSVNISIGFAAEKTRELKSPSLSRLSALLQERSGNLPAFFAEDPQGVRFPKFLAQLAEHFATGQQTVLRELESLHANVEHINEIVAMQQSYAGAGGIIETQPLPEVIEDALRMSGASCERQGMRVVRQFDASLPPVPMDRHKVLLILVNLIRNARHACDDAGCDDKCITVHAHLNGNGMAKISVSDNGVGIAPENQARIFEHGFTTRKSGHGFGLHSSALAAHEMSGSLHAHSDGPGQGATFTLQLPIASENS